MYAIRSYYAQANVLDFSGSLSANKDVAQISFTALEDRNNFV